MKKILSLLIILTPFLVNAQYDIEKAKKDSTKQNKLHIYEMKQNIFVGSSLNLSFGRSAFIYVAPQIGYDFSDHFAAGIQGMYQYFRWNTLGPTGSFSINAFSAGIFGKFTPVKPISIETSFNLYNTDQIAPTITGERIWTRSWLAGLTYNRYMGDRVFSYFSLYYNFIRDFNTPEPVLFSNFDNSFYLHYKFGLVIYPFS